MIITGAASQQRIRLLVDAPVEGVLHQAGRCNVAWVARGGLVVALVRQTGALGRWHAAQHSGGAPSKTISSGATPTRTRSLWGDGVFPQARPPDLERL